MADATGGSWTDMSWVTPVLMNLLTSAIFWVVIIIVGMATILIVLKVKKNRKMKIPVIIFTELSNGKGAFNTTKAGFFKKKRTFFGLIESGGEEECVTKEGYIIYGNKPEDLMEWDYERTLVVTPSLDDPTMLFPINKLQLGIATKQLMMDLPPIEIREAGVDAYKKTVVEMKDMREQIVQWIIIGLFFIVAFLVVLFITQYAKHIMDKQAEINAQTLDAQKQISADLVKAVQSLKGTNVANGQTGFAP